MKRCDQLTSAESAVFSYLSDGLTHAEIAERMKLSEHAVALFASSACCKLGARTRLHAMALFVRKTLEQHKHHAN